MALDFETANSDRGSICAIGIVVVSHGETVERVRRLIRPFDLYFDSYNTFIHGITAADVENEPEIDELWPVLSRYFAGSILVAHNASFDMSALRHTLDKYEIPYPSVDYTCTRLIAQRMWPGLLSYSLPVVAEHLGITFQHHDPVEDASASAEIARRACTLASVDGLQELAAHTSTIIGRLFPGGYHAARTREVTPRDIIPGPATDADPGHPFYGKTVVFTGTLQSMVRKDAWQCVANVGGTCLDTMNETASFLVIGDLDFRELRGGAKTNKTKKAETMIAKGKHVEVISEDDFLRLL